jgi:uncharacterized membrane protein YbhN (UPF0104 family)
MTKLFNEAMHGVVSLFAAIRQFFSSKLAYRVLVLAVFLSFLLAGQSLGLNLNSIAWHWLLLSAALAIPLLVCNAGEYWLIAQTNGLNLNLTHCIRVTLIGSVANLLPIPGQSATRIADLGSREVTLSRAAGTTLAAGALWSGWLFLVAGAASLDQKNVLWPATLSAVGVCCCLVSMTRISDPTTRFRWLLAGSAIELLTVLIAWVRLMLSFEALGIEYTYSSVAVLLCANVVAAVIGLTPAGLGVREGAAALIAPLVDINAIAAAVSMALTRFIGMIVSALLALIAYRPS